MQQTNKQFWSQNLYFFKNLGGPPVALHTQTARPAKYLWCAKVLFRNLTVTILPKARVGYVLQFAIFSRTILKLSTTTFLKPAGQHLGYLLPSSAKSTCSTYHIGGNLFRRNILLSISIFLLKFRCCEMVTKFENISHFFLIRYLKTSKQSGRFLQKICCLIRISELYLTLHL